MVSYIIWILYSAHRDRRKALRFARAMQLTEVISVPGGPRNSVASKKDPRKDCPKLSYDAGQSRENPAFSAKD
ncbi:hypothetical protein WN55_00809 [Dufourea novaeangliae]|uniref:Uncharacterized protein n=2 Tax=Dufourea novaeangliae TaxID=178035 RepID=A0A154PCP9_DUFNO|nr:hypothetical protein WN55_00809 [Dufourea novaeangliae]